MTKIQCSPAEHLHASRERDDGNAVKTAKAISPILAICCLLILILTVTGQGQDSDNQSGSKDYQANLGAWVVNDCMRIHDIGNIQFGISNFGRIGTGMKPFTDCYTGAAVPRAEFPRGSNTAYLYTGAIWVGAIVRSDTLVSCGADFDTKGLEFHSDQPLIHRSIINPDSPLAWVAVSEQDFEAVYTDTFTRDVPYLFRDPIAQRSHVPLNIEITQRSFAWSYPYTEDFVIIEFTIRNIGVEFLNDTYVGVYMDHDVHVAGAQVTTVPPDPGRKGITAGFDDITGFIPTYPDPFSPCDFEDTVGMAWTIDNDGDPNTNNDLVVPSVTGIRFMGNEFDLDRLSYNWWVWNYNNRFDYGPQWRQHTRTLGHGLGTPYGDINKYFLMSNLEWDFPQPYTYYVNYYPTGWTSVGDWFTAYMLSMGGDCQYLLSLGPFDLKPGDEITLPVAYVGGEEVFSDPMMFERNLGNRFRPDLYLNELDFSDLIHNSMTAARIYDNPGIDTDGDGYEGEFYFCVLDSVLVGQEWVYTIVDTFYYKGDGVPDLKGSAPPPAPDIWVSPSIGGLRVRFNGYRSETTRDLFSSQIDFEGYKVYVGRDNRASSYSLVTSYDRNNYDKMVFNPYLHPQAMFELQDNPFSLEELLCLYGEGAEPCQDIDFDILSYTASSPYVHLQFPESLFYFVKHDFNQSRLGQDTDIRKLYPHEPLPDRSKPLTEDQLTDDGYVKYYEYEVIINGLLPTLSYYVAVTAFDFGSPVAGLNPLESSKSLNATEAHPVGSEDELTGELDKVYVYPNPYRIDQNYRSQGFEGRMREDRPNDRVRQITFANLPPKCTIRVFSLDGDLIREIIHDSEYNDPTSRHATWDLITRNTQMTVSGLYYWTVEDNQGRVQIGKLVILM